MSTDTVSPLRQRTIEDMNARKLGVHTQRSHIYSPHLAETGASICNRNRIMTGLKFLLRVTLRRLDLAAEIYQYNKVLFLLEPNETTRPLARKQVTVID